MVDALYELEPMRHFPGLKFGHFLDDSKFRKYLAIFLELPRALCMHGVPKHRLHHVILDAHIGLIHVANVHHCLHCQPYTFLLPHFTIQRPDKRGQLPDPWQIAA